MAVNYLISKTQPTLYKFMGFNVNSFQQHKEIFGYTIPLSEIEQQLATFELTAILLRLAQINILLSKNLFGESIWEIQGFLRTNFFDEETYQRIEDTYVNKLQRVQSHNVMRPKASSQAAFKPGSE